MLWEETDLGRDRTREVVNAGINISKIGKRREGEVLESTS